jgi:arylsulfatase A-like enzyme
MGAPLTVDAGAEGGPLGTPNEVAFFHGVNKMLAETQVKWFDVWGTEETYNHMSAGRTWALAPPFTWFKQNASKLGGIRRAMAAMRLQDIKDKGGLREKFMHLIDVVPTILEVTGIQPPESVDGVEQAPIEGTSFPYAFDKDNVDAPTRHTNQCFEMMGQYALCHEGWLLSNKVNRAQWEAFGAGSDTLIGVNDADYKPPFTLPREVEQSDHQGRSTGAPGRRHQGTREPACGGGRWQPASAWLDSSSKRRFHSPRPTLRVLDSPSKFNDSDASVLP